MLPVTAVTIPGFVPQAVLVSLHQTTELAVYPSLYEGYGLPVMESMACGAPNIVGDNSSLREILPREARFAPEDPSAIVNNCRLTGGDGTNFIAQFNLPLASSPLF